MVAKHTDQLIDFQWEQTRQWVSGEIHFEQFVATGYVDGLLVMDSDSLPRDAGVQAQPGTIFFTGYLPPVCYQYSDESTCAGTAGGLGWDDTWYWNCLRQEC